MIEELSGDKWYHSRIDSDASLCVRQVSVMDWEPRKREAGKLVLAHAFGELSPWSPGPALGPSGWEYVAEGGFFTSWCLLKRQ